MNTADGPARRERKRLIRDLLFLVVFQALIVFAWGCEPGGAADTWGYKEFAKQAQMFPDDAEVHLNLGLTLLYSDGYQEAVRELKKAVEINPRHAEAHLNLGRAYKSLGKIEEAIAEYWQAIRVNPRLFQPYFYLGALYLARHDIHGAISSLETAIRLKPDDAESHLNLGVAYDANGEGEKALVRELTAYAICSAKANSPETKALLEEIKILIRKYAEKYRIDPGSLAGKIPDMGTIEAELQASRWKRILALDPANIHARLGLGALYFDKREWEDSARELEEAAGLCKICSDAYLLLSGIYKLMGREEESAIALKEAVRINPRAAIAKEGVAGLFSKYAFRRRELSALPGDEIEKKDVR